MAVAWNLNPSMIESIKKEAGNKYEKPPTEHAKTSIAEDIADSTKLFILDEASQDKLRSACPRRFELLDDMMADLRSHLKKLKQKK